MRRALLGCALLAIGMTVTAPSVAEQLVVNGRNRTYVIERPTVSGPRPTIIMLHGAHSTGADFARATKLGRLAPQQGFVAVFPDGPRPHWNFFLPGRELEFYVKASKAAGGVPDDGAFLKSLIADLVQRGIADPQRIYLAGESSGSVMALRMLCTDADLFAGMALIGPAMPERTGPQCHPSRPVPMLLIKGTKDEVFPYSGGLIKPEETFLVWPQDQLVSFLQQLNTHATPPRSSVLPLKVPNTVAIDRWESCSGTLLTVYRVIDGPHVAPNDLNAGQVALNFFTSPMRSGACVASLPGSPGNPGQTPGANSNGNTGTPGGDPNGATPGTGTGPDGTPNTATNDPGTVPGAGADPNVPGGITSPGGGPGDTGGLGPPAVGGAPGTNTAGLGPPPDNNPANPTGGLGPPPDPPAQNTTPPGVITTLTPPYPPPIFIPIPGGGSMPPGQVCHPKSGNGGNAPVNPCSKQATPLKLKPNTTETAAIPPPQNTGMLHLKPAQPTVPASVTPTSPASLSVQQKAKLEDPLKKKMQAEKKHPPKYNNGAAGRHAATNIAGLRRGGGGGGHRGNPYRHHR